ncbi:putative nucleoprotein [Xinzhou nematode virus 4]|uniref:Nucleoprotein n=1 Tax=Xinzhou nematode virus 4 TaxID=1923772 RepID=A0A1L3KNA6_9RHAB|nr:putative nucleoprotein [Xinzhou nematode virus 4]APG78853.1 putative nucleoprotein [Xinzhou nematode virus 4]
MASEAPKAIVVSSVYNWKTGEKSVIPSGLGEVAVQYPHEVIKAKRAFTFPVFKHPTNELDTQLEEKIIASDMASTTPISVALSFLFKVLPVQLSGTLSERWESYGIEIGRKGQTVNPLSLIEVTPDHLEPIGAGGDPSKKDNVLGMLAKCLAVYRIQNTPRDQPGYRANLALRLHDLYKGAPFELSNMAGIQSLTHWIQDSRYTAVVAAVDMFLRKFPGHPLEKLRACTLGSYDKDCATLASIDLAAKSLGADLTTLVTHMLGKTINKDMERILHCSEREEFGKEDSYFHYVREFGYLARSPYSASANKNLFTWCQMIGVLMGIPRSINARMLDADSPKLLLIEAAFLAHHLGSAPEFERLFVATQEEANALKRNQEELDREAGVRYKNPSTLLAKLHKAKFTLTPEIKNCFLGSVNALVNPRPQTVGEFVKNYFI